MKRILMQLLAAVVMGAAGLVLCPTPAAAVHLTVAPPVQTPAVLSSRPTASADFSDADFSRADQPSLGALRGGAVVVVVGGTIVLLLLLILLLAFLDELF
ncbi:MAG: hypothetical protein ACREJ2_06875 [Planctomycetota bacterium]